MVILYLIFGIIGGLLGGMGMGGGTLLIPLLSLGLNVNQQTAQLINMLSFIPMSFLTLIVHARNGYVVKNKLIFIVIPAVLFAVVGSIFAAKTDTEILKKAFGAFLVALGILYLVGIFIKKIRRKPR